MKVFVNMYAESILAVVPHGHFTFTIPKMLRPYFRFHRGLIKQLCHIAHQCVIDFLPTQTLAPARRAARRERGCPMSVSKLTLFVMLLGECLSGCAVLRAESLASPQSAPPTTKSPSTTSAKTPLSQFIRRIFEDRSGRLWFGTNGDGVGCYNGKAMEFFRVKEGFPSEAVRAIVQDKHDAIWFGTDRGLIKYDGVRFTTYTTEHGLAHDDIWSIIIDRDGLLWIGTLGGVSRFDGKTFTAFPLPAVEPNLDVGVTSDRMVRCIMQDKSGRMWFGTPGGAFVHDGKSCTRISEADGLCDNSVNDILEDRQGRIWFATHNNGICYRVGDKFTHITAKDGVNGTEAWDLYEDPAGNIWFPIENSGVYRYDGKTFKNFAEAQGLTTNAIQCTYQDRTGRFWLGGWQGLFRFDGETIVSVDKDGPWEVTKPR